MASRDAYQKLCGLIADPGSSLINFIRGSLSLARKNKKRKKLQATSCKLDNETGTM